MRNIGRVIVPMVTPFTDDLAVNYDEAVRMATDLVEKHQADSISLTGTMGEFYTLTIDERLELIARVTRAVGEKIPIIAGTGSISTAETIEITRQAEKIGVDMALVVTPFYCRPTQEEIYDHFKAVAESTSLPIMLYNIPSFSGVNIEVDTVVRLSEVDNIVAIKEEGSNSNQASELALRARRGFLVYSGSDLNIIHVLSQGGVGSYCNQMFGSRFRELMDNYFAGRVERAKQIHLELYPVLRALVQNGRSNPVPLTKAGLSILGYDAGPPRPPLKPATKQELETLKEQLEMLP